MSIRAILTFYRQFPYKKFFINLDFADGKEYNASN